LAISLIPLSLAMYGSFTGIAVFKRLKVYRSKNPFQYWLLLAFEYGLFAWLFSLFVMGLAKYIYFLFKYKKTNQLQKFIRENPSKSACQAPRSLIYNK
jgi:hypothetical protein